MPEDSKKTQHKGKHDAKEQRKPRQQRQYAAEKSEKKTEKKVQEPKVVVPSKPAYEDPGPEFYKSLKRETDEILKITEEANAKYKKKDIQSNWTKYEMPIESYEEIEEQENLGADYEKLIQAPVSAGGHFQFKHEKSWDINTGPSLYDKYFEINMDNLATAISTIPFFERTSIDQSVFSQTDLISMNSRSVKYKRKYYNDKSYTTPEMECLEAILNNTKDNLKSTDDKSEVTEVVEMKTPISESADIDLEARNEVNAATKLIHGISDLNLEAKNIDKTNTKLENPPIKLNKNIVSNEKNISQNSEKTNARLKIHNNEIDDIVETITDNNTKPDVDIVKTEDPTENDGVTPAVADASILSEVAVMNPSKETSKPAIESPEDLEKWLDDFLDG